MSAAPVPADGPVARHARAARWPWYTPATQHRQAYVELSKLQRQRDEYNIEFGRLQTRAGHRRPKPTASISIATEKLSMHFPLETETTVVQP